MRRYHLLAAAVPIAVLLLAGCGGGGGETTETTAETAPVPPKLSKADLLKQGDAICAEVNAAIGSLSTTASQGASRAAQEAELYSGMIERLKALGMPEEGEGYEQFIAAADEFAQAENAASVAAGQGDTAALESAQAEADSARTAFQSSAEEFGFEACSEAPSAPVPAAGGGAPSEEVEPEATGGVEEGVEEEPAPEVVEEEPAPEVETGAGGGAEAGGGTGGGEEAGGGGSSSGGIGPG